MISACCFHTQRMTWPEIQFLGDRFLPSSFTDSAPGWWLEETAASLRGNISAHAGCWGLRLHPAPWSLLLGSHSRGHTCSWGGLSAVVPSLLYATLGTQSRLHLSQWQQKQTLVPLPQRFNHLQGTPVATLSLLPSLFPWDLEGPEPSPPPLSLNKPPFLSLPAFFRLNVPPQDLPLSSTLWA